MTKHEKIYSLAVSKRASIQALVSKAWNDNSITDREFQFVNSELEQYFKLKESLSTNKRHKPPKKQPHDLEKLKKQIRDEVREELQKQASLSITILLKKLPSY